GNSVATIGSSAFAYNILTNVIFLGDFGTFDLNMFEGNSNLTRITYVEGKTGWEDKTFAPEPCCTITPTLNVFDDGNLAYRITSSTTVEVTGRASGNTDTEIVIPDTVTNLAVIYSVTTIGDSAFFLKSLTSVTIGNSVTTIGDKAFADTGITSVTIGNSVTTIEFQAFSFNDLISLTLPDSVTTIEGNAFSFNNALTSVTFLGNFGTFELNMFEGSSNLTAITYVQGKTGWPKTFTLGVSGSVAATNTFEQAGFAYVISSAATATVTGRASGNTDTVIEIPDTVASNGITYSVTSIGDAAFFNNNLASLTIGNNVTTIGDNAFGFNELTSVAIPDSVTTIRDNAFRDNKLTSVTLGDSVTTIGNGAFRNNQLTSLTIPNSVTSIGNGAFRKNSLTSLTIPNNVTTIGSNAFKDNNLTEVTFMGNFGTFDLNMFTGNSDLTTITYDEDKSGWPVTFTPAGKGSVAVVPKPLPGLPIWLLYQATQ
ncbi:leucine-rich repeat domain-containing protein, partial [Luminiphilus sp.]|nr:leucine-rich repeat domain-containing protein [Luminiphilus sp.]